MPSMMDGRQEGLSLGYAYGRVEDAHYARMSKIDHAKRAIQITRALKHIDDFVGNDRTPLENNS